MDEQAVCIMGLKNADPSTQAEKGKNFQCKPKHSHGRLVTKDQTWIKDSKQTVETF